MSELKNINKALGEHSKFYPNYLANQVASDFKFHLERGIGRLIDNHDLLVEEIAQLKKDRDEAISKMSKSWRHDAESQPDLLSRFVDMANRQFDILQQQKIGNADLREALLKSQQIMNTFGLIHGNARYSEAEKCKRAGNLISIHMDEVFIANKKILNK